MYENNYSTGTWFESSSVECGCFTAGHKGEMLNTVYVYL